MSTNYNLIVIGAGPGGYVGAIRAAQLGMKVLLVEKAATMGGTCLNVGCIPSKALLSSSALFRQIQKEAADHGIVCAPPSIDVKAMISRKNRVVGSLTRGVASLLKGNKVDVIRGSAEVSTPGIVRVGSEEYRSDSILIATGSRPAELPFLPFDHTSVVDSTDALEFSEIPERLLIVGAGVIGLELGSVWSRLGACVQIIESMPEILTGWDRDIAKTVQKSLEKQGIEFHCGVKILEGNSGNSEVNLKAQAADGNFSEFRGNKVLVAAGRKPVWEGIDTIALGIETENGRITVSDRYETGAAGIFAVGDCIAGPMLAHKASEEAAACVEMLAGKYGKVNYSLIPGALYTHPEAAMVGKTEEQCRKEGIEYKKGIFRFSGNGRAIAAGNNEGMVKILTRKKDDTVLGVHIAGEHASELIHEAAVLMEFGGSAEDLARTIHAHPSLAEAVKEAAMAAWERPIHSL